LGRHSAGCARRPSTIETALSSRSDPRRTRAAAISIGGPSIHHEFKRDDGRVLSVDADLWLCVLDLAAVGGWKPVGTEPPAGTGPEGHDRLAYFEPTGRRVVEADARELARCLDRALPSVSDAEVPLGDRRFGDDNTRDLLARAAAGGALGRDEAQGALELLSGPPKSEAKGLVDFLKGGAFEIHAAVPRLRGVHGRP
jgi:hypothetical protein